MRTVLATVVLAAVLTGCEARDREPGDRADLGRNRETGDTTIRSADTTVTEREVEDTTIVRTDTTVRVDTVKKTGGTRAADTSARTR
jgi:hypothetical protein